MKKIKDPMRDHYITVSEDLVDIIDTPEIQRLRRIQQLGFSSLVYPGATHTRFSHTLGVLWTTKQFIESLGLDNSDTARQLKIASILHDSGHGPYSHVIESVEGAVDHEQKSCEIVEELASRGLINGDDVTPVKEFIHGNRNPSVLSGDIDSDRMDYLSRDAHYTGISHGSIDSQTITESAEIIDGKIVFDKMSIQAIEGLLVSRKNMHGSVYSHPTVRSAEKMLSECIEREESITADTVYEYCDKTLHTELARSSDEVVNELYDKITTRDLYKTAFCLRQMHNVDPDSVDQEQFESEIKDELDISEHELFIDWYSPKPDELSITINMNGDLVDFSEISGVDQLIAKDGYAVQMSVYCPEDYEREVKELCEKKLGL